MKTKAILVGVTLALAGLASSSWAAAAAKKTEPYVVGGIFSSAARLVSRRARTQFHGTGWQRRLTPRGHQWSPAEAGHL